MTKPEDVTAQLSEAIKAYSMATQAALEEGRDLPFAYLPESGVTDTDIMIVITSLLREAELDLFEVEMWRSLGGSR